MGIYKSKEVLKQVIVRKPDHKLQIKITVDISTHALEWVKRQIIHSKKYSELKLIPLYKLTGAIWKTS